VWLARPIITNTSTQQASMSTATRAALANRMPLTLSAARNAAARNVPGASPASRRGIRRFAPVRLRFTGTPMGVRLS
jgi:hypothetical protein